MVTGLTVWVIWCQCLELSLTYGPSYSSLQHLGGILPKATSIQQRQGAQLDLGVQRFKSLICALRNCVQDLASVLVRAGIASGPMKS